MAERRPAPRPDASVRMFDHDLLEALTHMHPATPWFVGVPVFALMAWWALVEGLSLRAWPFLFVAGLFAWTFLEYVMHRFVFHYHPKSAWGEKVHFMVHGVHHEYPQDASRLVMPPALSIPLGLAVTFLLWVLFGAPAAPAMMTGMVSGYIAYDTVHYLTHHRPMRGRIGRALKRYHMRHHFADPDRGYGVSSPLWDLVFRTRPRPERPSKAQKGTGARS